MQLIHRLLLGTGLLFGWMPTLLAQQADEPDISFAGTGIAFLDGVGEVRDVIQLQDERLLAVVSATDSTGTIHMLTISGEVDGAFGQSGIVDLAFSPIRVFQQSDGRIIVVGNHEFGRVARYHLDGTVDEEYTENGSTTLFLPLLGQGVPYRDADLDPEDRLYIVGDHLSKRAALLRLDQQAQLDTTFNAPHGHWGYVAQLTSQFGSVLCRGVRIDADGTLYVLFKRTQFNGPPSGPSGHLRILRYNSDGASDGFVYSRSIIPPYTDVIPSTLFLSTTGNISFVSYSSYYGTTGIVRVRLSDGEIFIRGGWIGWFPPNVGVSDEAGRAIFPYSNASFHTPSAPVNNFLGFSIFRSMPENVDYDLTWGGTGVVQAFQDSTEGSAAMTATFQEDGRLVVGGFVRSQEVQRPVLIRYTYIPGPQAKVDLRVFLGGSYETSLGTMRDDLRANAALPIQHPYDPDLYIPAGVEQQYDSPEQLFDSTGTRAPVDWVWLELLDADDTATVVSTRVGMLRRDGRVTAPDSEELIDFDCGVGSYFLRVRHRNHLSVTASTPLQLGAVPTVVDLSDPATPTFGLESQKEVDGVMVLWPGDVNANGRVSYAGASNDRDPILVAIGGSTPSAVLSGYHPEDVNMDGEVKYTGSNNDRDIILQTIGGTTPHLVRWAQEP